MKKALIKIRSSVKLFIIISIATFLIAGIVFSIYKPIYSVTLNGELIGYCSKKSKLQTRIDEYIENGNGDNSNLAFVEIESMPQYKMCLLKKGITTNDDEIFQKVINDGTSYYKYYSILGNAEEKVYVSDYQTAENIVQSLKEKNSDNIDDITIIEKYETELANFVNSEDAVNTLYKEKKVQAVKVAKNTGSTKNFSTATNISKSKVSIGISLIKPISGTITSRFGASSRIRSSAHTGLDIGASKGSAIKSAASGTVTWAGYKGSYGNLVVITHSNGVQTYYGHCSKLYVSNGQKVSQGDTIAAVGSTGNSTGPHLHFEVRVNGVAYNPQNYVY